MTAILAPIALVALAVALFASGFRGARRRARFEPTMARALPGTTWPDHGAGVAPLAVVARRAVSGPWV